MPRGVEVRRLEPDDDRTGFSCGDIELDRFFQRYAGQNQFRHHIGSTWIAVEESQILGFLTVAATQVEVGDLPADVQRRLPRYPVPALRLARLAVDRRGQGRGIGLTLLKVAFVLAWKMADDFGCAGVVVDAKPGAISFYERFGFIRLEVLEGALGDRPEPLPMFLALSAIPRASGTAG